MALDSTSQQEICLICSSDQEFREEDETVKNKELVNLDYIKYREPVDLLKAFIYNKYKYEKIKLDVLCADLTRQSGMTWNKNFKPKYGPIEKYLKKYEATTFELDFDKGVKQIKLKPHDRINIVASNLYSNNELIESCLQEVQDVFQPTESASLLT